MAAIPKISESTRLSQLKEGQKNNNFVRASEYNALVTRVNSFGTEDGALSLTGDITLDDLTVNDDATITGDLAVAGAVDIDGAVTIDGTTASTSTTTGILTVDGGVGIAKELFVSTTTPASISATGVLSVTNATDATTPTTGSVKVTGGMGVAKALYVGTSVNATTYVTSGNGTVSLPAIGPVSDPDSGLYVIGANNLGMALNGAKVLDMATTGLGVTGVLTSTGVMTATGGVAAPGGNFTMSPRNCAIGGLVPAVSTDFTDATPVNTETYIGEVFVPANCTVTGIAVFNGSNVTDNIIVALADASGAIVAQSISTAGSGADSYQRIAFTGTYAAKGPATYYILSQYAGSTSRYNAPPLGSFGASKKTGEVFGTFTAITPPTTFTTNLCNIASLY